MADAKSTPILFSGPMVRAIIEGRKTQTRRKVSDNNTQGNWKPSECDLSSAFVDPGPSPAGNPGPYLKALVTKEALKDHGWSEDDEIRDRIYPRIFPGDELWVREKARCSAQRDDSIEVTYAADRLEIEYPFDRDRMRWFPEQSRNADLSLRWAPAIFMPRWASRLTLTVKAVRVERLQDISEEDAKAEGLKCLSKDGGQTWKYGIPDVDGEPGNDDFGWHWQDWSTDPRLAYRHLWESINGPGSWDANPWVWVYEFSVKSGGPRG